ncbi:hypothetical protein EOK75_00645 [Pseudorhodobacter turbinis]|uniref:Acetolactate synthase n=1 Tax=Pseudorhodobacter turbinis TaxID=2500533 RepID=A0A4P8ECM6_9RHOB|nr:DUF6497 family protein [Pseudorhodobacter turbinis]QCO54458.1 hypothetical protein EOK75_00645 [Pseudorhodobacter turbinis]
MTQRSQDLLWRIAGGDAQFTVPSGQHVTLQEMFWEEGDELVLRARFVAPQIARAEGALDHDAAAVDMAYLCDRFVLPQLQAETARPAQIILSLSDVELPFGQSDPDATQFFEAYRLDGDACISEVF